MYHFITPTTIKLSPRIITGDYAIDWSPLLRSLSFSLPTIQICFGTPNDQCFNLTPNTISSYTILNINHSASHLFNHSLSSTFTQSGNTLSFTSNNVSITGNTVSDIIGIPTWKFIFNKHFPFLLSRNLFGLYQINIDGFIGLHKYYNSETFFHLPEVSLVNYFYENQFLIRKSFTLNYTDDGRGTIEFGKDTTLYSKCYSLINDIINPNWDCNVSQVQFGDKVMKLTKNKAIFNSISSLITVPKPIRHFLLDYFIVLSDRHCFLINESKKKYIRCDREINIFDIPDIVLQLGEVVHLKLRWANMLKLLNENTYLSTIVVDMENDSIWEIGIPGFIGNSITFDNEDSSIGIIEQKSIDNSTDKRNINKVLISIVSLIEVIGIAIVIIVKTKRNNNKIITR